MGQREIDVTLFGATGFTGRLVAEQLAQRAPEGTRIALAGRSRARLAEVRDSLGPAAVDWPLIVANARDAVALQGLAERSTAVATTAGPYVHLGMPLVTACALAGTHYVDLTGEVLFMRASIDANDTAARRSGARIVHACGFDSIPSDLGVLLLHGSAGELGETTLVVREARGGFSGGTVATMREQLATLATDPNARRILADPYALSPDRGHEPALGDERELAIPVHDPELGWLAPFFMASVNTRVVRRSNALAGYPYSRLFRYREAMAFGEGRVAAARAALLSAGMGGLAAGMVLRPTRALLDRVLPRQGEGPDAHTRETGRFRVEVIGRAADARRHVATVAADSDPGYGATSLMLAESALLAALGDPSELPDRAGVLTPATAFGTALVERLRTAGMTLEAHAVDP